MARLFSFAILLILAWPAVPAAAPQKKATTKKSAATSKKAVTSKKQASAKSPAASKKPAATQKKRVTSSKSAASSRSRSSKKASTRTASRSWRQTQQAPTPERYREIQRALAEKGFLKTEPTGSWGPQSVEALREFQRANNLPDSGKIDSLSLFALGLGPKRAAAAKSSEPETAAQQP